MIEYYESYIKIVEAFVNGAESLEVSEAALKELNTKYPGSHIKETLPGTMLTRDEDDEGNHWIPSEICY